MNVSPLCSELVYQLRQLAKFEKDPHKSNSYKKASDSILENAETFDEMVIKGDFKILPGIGDSINKKISEFLMTGHINKLRELQNAKNE
jgi:DNA polymerase/3'-5' exonuclease PolX